MKLALAFSMENYFVEKIFCSTLICGHTGHRVVQHKAGAGVDSKRYF